MCRSPGGVVDTLLRGWILGEKCHHVPLCTSSYRRSILGYADYMRGCGQPVKRRIRDQALCLNTLYTSTPPRTGPAPSPSAPQVDNLVERLVRSEPKLKVVRLGHPARLLPAVLDSSLEVGGE